MPEAGAPTVLIAGAGIGGLVTALSLRAAGAPVVVFESVPRILPLGVGINLLPHAVRELTELGLATALAETAIPTGELAYYTKRGQLIWREPRGLEAGYRWPQFSIHRGELQMILWRAAAERLGQDAIACGHHLAGFDQDEDGVTAHFVDRTTGRPLRQRRGALLVAADGIHSSVRTAFYPDEGPPKWNGSILWRGMSEGRPFLSGRSMIMAGHEHQKFVCYPISARAAAEGRAVLNWIAERRISPDTPWRREDWNRPGRTEDFLPLFESWRFDWLDVPGLIRGATSVFEFPMVDRDPVPRWTHGRVTLLGDAAHPMYPIGSNGASQAILDARILTREILTHGITPAALQAYEAERRPATARLVLLNRQNGPEQVMQLVENRAPAGFAALADVISAEELETTAANYKQVAGFDRDALNSRGPIVPEGARLEP